MLPTHLPLNALDRLIRDYTKLTATQSDEYSPLEMLTGYYEGGEYGGMPFENPESDETDPLKRLKEGERLAIQLHVGLIEAESEFIDGNTYTATVAEIAKSEERVFEPDAFPDETGFFGIGIWLDGDRLALEQIRISGDMDGDVGVAPAVFPKSLATRVAAYLNQIAGA